MMFKQCFILTVTVVLFLIELRSANTDINSAYAEEAFSSSYSGKVIQSTSFNNYNEEQSVCGQDEVYDDYLEDICKAENCSQLGYSLECKYSSPKYHTQGCVCKDGYLRADNRSCVPAKSCPSCGGDINAEAGCGINCNRHCSNIGQEPQLCVTLCKDNACDCKEGFYFDGNTGKCVLPEDCTSTCGINEVYTDCVQAHCGPKECSQINTPVLCPYLNNNFCIEGCICKDNYIRDHNGICIPKNKCPRSCGKNEIYTNCLENECKTLHCYQLGLPSECPKSQLGFCTEGCICKYGFLRADDGTCIPTTTCPICGGDPNAELGCGINCNKHCYNIGREPEICIDVCYENACDCKDGFYFDDNIEKCVLPYQCTKSSISTSSSAISTSTASVSESNIEIVLSQFRKGNLALTGELLYQMVQSKPGLSFVTSALSALIPFAELTLYAFGFTLYQLLNLINLENKDQVRRSFPLLLKDIQSQKTVIFKVANKFYGNKNYPLSDTFKLEAIRVFNSEGEDVDFSNTFETTDIINKWVANKTNNLIQHIALPETLDPNTQLMCVNALYFLGNWRIQFNPNKTTNRDFYTTPNKTKSVPVMYQQSTFNYAEDRYLNAQIIELDYKGENFSCVIWLPKKIDGLTSMVEKLRDPDIFFNSMKSFRSEIVKVYLPKMDISTDINLVDLLVKANVTEVFNLDSAELKGILKTDYVPVCVTDVIQKARIKVDETGTEAAVAIGGTTTTTSIPFQSPLIQDFNANHPYVFCIKYQKILVFCGVFH